MYDILCVNIIIVNLTFATAVKVEDGCVGKARKRCVLMAKRLLNCCEKGVVAMSNGLNGDVKGP